MIKRKKGLYAGSRPHTDLFSEFLPPPSAIRQKGERRGQRLTAAGIVDQRAQDITARIWDGATGKVLLVFFVHTESAWPGDWSPDGKRIASFSNKGTVRILDASTGVELRTLFVPALYRGYAW